jgi:hypothetical protein
VPVQSTAVTSDAVIYLPGIMGSELVDADGKVLWGMKPSLLFRQAAFGNVMEALIPRQNDGIRASRPIQWPIALPLLSAMEPYTALERRIKQTVLHDDAVRAFAYDWRGSIVDAAAALAVVARSHLSQWTARWNTLSASERRGLPEPRLTLVCHSMGGLVGSYFAAFGDDDRIVHRIVTLGTPFGGSLNAVRALATGEQLPFGLFAKSLRDSIRRMPGVYELLARWKCVVENDALRRISPSDIDGIGADAALATDAIAVMDRLQAAFTDSGRRPPVRCLTGTTQPTRQTVRFVDGIATFEELIEGTDHRGDGTVFRYAAAPPGVEPAYLPQSHGAVAKTDEATAFVAAVLTERSLGEFQAPPGIGLRVPDIVTPGLPFSANVLDGRPGVMCHVYDTEDNRLLNVNVARAQGQDLVATLTVPRPGLYRITASGGGFSPVEQLVAAVA